MLKLKLLDNRYIEILIDGSGNTYEDFKGIGDGVISGRGDYLFKGKSLSPNEGVITSNDAGFYTESYFGEVSIYAGDG